MGAVVLLQSMTGFGESRNQRDGLAVVVEVRTINNRYFKLSVRASEGYASLDPLVESEVRALVNRGTVQVNIRVDRQRSTEDYKINVEVLDRYRRQIEFLREQWRYPDGKTPSLESLLPLPGVVDDVSGACVDAAGDWPFIQQVLKVALENLGQMRREEGLAMAADLAANCRAAAACLGRIEQRAPSVVEDYRGRLLDRLKRTLKEAEIQLSPADLIKEVALFADRSDISEEIVRLKCHLEQFQTIMELPESSGRKLDFLTQEMFRETNTIGSKANDTEIAREVIEIKAIVERIREMIQNIE